MKNKPIVIRMAGGLANRMFQYSYYLFLKRKGYVVYVDNNYQATKWKMEDIDWCRIFPQATLNQASQEMIFKYAGGYDFISKVRKRLDILNSSYQMPTAVSIPSENLLEKRQYIIGIFQNAEMINEVCDDVRSAFCFSDFQDQTNINVAEDIESCNSVAIHVRKGKDYLTRDVFKGTCTIDYYKHAIDFIEEKVQNPRYFLFTDNPMWVNDNFNFIDYKLINVNPSVGWGNHYDMQLMSICKHNIIANSTYSWWGAYLNNNKEKIVICPQNWFNVNHKNLNEDIYKTYLDSWIVL